MKFIVIAACIFGMALCAPQMYMEFDIHHAPAQAAPVIPAGALPDSLEVVLPVDAQGLPVAGPGFIKQEIPQPNGLDSKDVFYPFGFDVPVPAVVVPVVPDAPAVAAPADPAVAVAVAVPAAPAAPAVVVAVPAAPAAPAQPVIAAAPAPTGDDDDDDDD
ncbi:secretory calcium-binding phosphoprotein 7 [Parambassis ranga]|uniref:Secretory calcium-binding phosphoprotein 7 n=1 Tax=Parambassis ranga TaxID=210632 RepID=A0A6P7J086_9TELE|nr:protein app1-like [Parambassis ranga]